MSLVVRRAQYAMTQKSEAIHRGRTIKPTILDGFMVDGDGWYATIADAMRAIDENLEDETCKNELCSPIRPEENKTGSSTAPSEPFTPQ